MKILICGFYGHCNFGDDCFVKVFNDIFPGKNLKFIDVVNIDLEELDGYHAIVVGGGDLLNNFYGLKYEEVLRNYTGYKIAVGVGVSFKECARKKYISYFDDIILRSKEDILDINLILGSMHVHYMPDLTYSLPVTPIIKEYNGKDVGVYLVGTMRDIPSLLFSVHTCINYVLTRGYTVHLIPMYFEEDGLDDIDISENILSVFRHRGDQIKTHPIYEYDKFVEVMSNLDYAICARFHSHVFCTKLGIPFVSIPLTRKVEIFNKELPYQANHEVEVIRDRMGALVSINSKSFKKHFNEVVETGDVIKSSFLYMSDINSKMVINGKIKSLITNAKKNIIEPLSGFLSDPEKIYTKYVNIFLEFGVNHHTDNSTLIMESDSIDEVADMLCYDITGNMSNSYNYGTRCNLRTKLYELRDMIYYILGDFNNHLEYPKINIDYIKQRSFGGIHRAGWSYSIGPMYYLSGDHGALLDVYLDRSFGWSSSILKSIGILPYTNYWSGFFHHTFETEFAVENNCTNVFASSLFRDSLAMCKGIFCLTKYLADQVSENLKILGYGYIPVSTLTHPTIFVSDMFTMEKFTKNENRKLINVGGWYRNPITINRAANLSATSYCSFAALKGKKMEASFCPDNVDIELINGKLESKYNKWTQYFCKYVNSSCDEFSTLLKARILSEVQNEGESINVRNVNGKDLLENFLSLVDILEFMPDDEYDQLFTKNIIFLDLIDSSAVNTIIESIVRDTPLVVNRIAPTVELLGDDYPLFYDNINDIDKMLTHERIEEAHMYIKALDKSCFRLETFSLELVESEVYKNIPTL
jgi:hypothetical protein